MQAGDSDVFVDAPEELHEQLDDHACQVTLARLSFANSTSTLVTTTVSVGGTRLQSMGEIPVMHTKLLATAGIYNQSL